jgi:hypothetical protein
MVTTRGGGIISPPRDYQHVDPPSGPTLALLHALLPDSDGRLNLYCWLNNDATPPASRE